MVFVNEFVCKHVINTPPKTKMEHQNGALEDDFPFQKGKTSGSMLVFGGVHHMISYARRRIR